MKLVVPIVQSLGLPVADPRFKVVAVAPDFIWAFILFSRRLNVTELLISKGETRGNEGRTNDRGGTRSRAPWLNSASVRPEPRRQQLPMDQCRSTPSYGRGHFSRECLGSADTAGNDAGQSIR